MFDLESFLQEEAVETTEVEYKSALGKDGLGELPKDFWPTYSAFANTHGGTIYLGVRERNAGFELVGLNNAQKVQNELMDLLCSKQKVSACLTTDEDITLWPLPNGREVISVKVRAAERSQRPVYINNHLFNAYHRFNSGDRLYSESDIKALIRDQGQSVWDAEVLPDFGFDDLDTESVAHYRQRFKNHSPHHQFNENTDEEFLKNVGVIRFDRKTKTHGLTKAGLLVLGKQNAILEVFPRYFVDYQLNPHEIGHERWTDRVWPNGDWAGNLLRFYEIVFRKLINNADLKTAFRLHADVRIEDTSLHTAIREALVNTIVHTDFESLMNPLTVRQHDDKIIFENAGRMLIDLSLAQEGAFSACRNPFIQRLFGLIGLGERAGTGITKIMLACAEHVMPDPIWEDRAYPAQTRLTLALRQKRREDFGKDFTFPFIDDSNQLSDDEKSTIESLAQPIASRARVSPETLAQLYLKMCEKRYMTKSVLAELSNRSMPRIHAVINQLVKEHRMEVYRKDRHSEMGYRTIC